MTHRTPTARHWVTGLLIALFLSAPALAAPPPVGSTPGLRAYWNTNARTSDRSGHVDWELYNHVTQVDQVNFVKTRNAFYTGGPTDYFAARFVGQIEIPADGIWTFRMESDQSSMLFIDGSPLIIDDSGHSYHSRSSIISLTPGLHDFEVRYWEGWSDAGVIVFWDGPGMDAEEVIPASAFTSPADEPVYDPGGDGLWAYWYHNARHASNVGQIDWVSSDRVETVQRPSYLLTRSGFEVGGPTDYFAARFMGIINVAPGDGGVWTFDLGSDQSALLFIDGIPVVSDASGHSYHWRSGTIELAEGDHAIEVRYWEGWSDAGLHVAWKGPNSAFTQIIPSSAYKPGTGATNPPSGGGLHAYRYDNARHAGNVGQVDWVDHDSMETVQNIYWPITHGSFYTGGPTDYFASRFVGKITVPRSGAWTFSLGSDQSARLTIDGVTVINDASGHSYHWRSGTVSLAAGEHDIEVQHWEGWSDAGLALTWKGPGDTFERVVPATAFSPNAVDPALGTGGDGLRVYWVDNARHASKVGHIDWQNYDRMTFEANIAWEITHNPFVGTTIVNSGGQSTSEGGTQTDYFGLRAVGQVNIPSDGNWTFGLGSDQSAQLFIDGQMVINDDSGHSYHWRSGEINLTSGLHNFEVRYWEGWSDAGLIVSWTPPGGVEQVIPPNAFSHSAVETPFDSGGGGLRAYWTTNARHASNAGQIDWSEHDHATTVPNVAWQITRSPFDDTTPSDYFGLRLLGRVDVPASGAWTFSLGSDQSAILLIDGEPVVIDTSGHSYHWRSGSVQLTQGKHDIEVRFWEGWSDAGLNLAWRGPTVPADIIIPRTAFSLQPTETPLDPGGGLRAYWTTNARHASNAGQIDYAEHSTSTIVDNVSWQVTRDPFFLDGPTDYYGLRLISQLTIPESDAGAGTWTFNMGSDQSAILLIDDQPVIVDTSGHSYHWRSGTIALSPGVHKFEVRYWEGWSDAGLNITWRAPGTTLEEIIPASAFNVYDPEPVFDNGAASLTAQWFSHTRGAHLTSMDWSFPSKTTTEPRVSWNITRDSFEPSISSDYFALKVTGKLSVPSSGQWTFNLGSDQYAILLIDGQRVVSDTSGHSYHWRSGAIQLSKGEHDLEVQFMEGWSDAGLFLSWRGPNDLFEEIIPASAFVSKSTRVKIVQWREIGAEHNR
jgi:PA14 domain